MLHARAGAAAIAAALALSPTYAAAPKPIIDLSQSPALNGKAAPASAQPAKHMIGPVDEQTAEIGGGALAVFILACIAAALISRRRRRLDEAAWQYDEPAAEETVAEHHHVHEVPMELDQPAIVAPEPSAFAFGKTAQERPMGDERGDGSDRRPGESWVERAYRGPSPANPSVSLKNRLSRAAFFDKREREVAAGTAEPVDPEAGLPEAMVEEQDREFA